MLDQLRDAVRSVRHRRWTAAAIVTTLTLGIGANSAIFSFVDAVLLRPLPYPDADRLVAVYELNQGLKQATQLVAPVRLEEWNRDNHTFAGLAGSYFENVTDTTGALPERIEAMRTSPRFFAVLGVAAALGRTLSADEERFGGRPAVVISERFWHARFNSTPDAVGRQLILSGVSRTIVGVMPASFRYPTATTDAWIPAQMSAGLMRERRARFYTAVGRMRPGVTLERAQADLTSVQARLGDEFPETDKGWAASLAALKEEQVGGVRRSLWLLFAAVGLVLLAACGNVACLLLAEAVRRRHEVAVRVAVGASRATIVRQLLTEGFILALASASCALLVARWATAVLRRIATDIPRVDEVQIDGRLVLFTIVVGALTTVAFALAPAVQVTKVDPADALARGGRGQIGGRHLLQRTLVATQLALAIVLLVGAGLLIRSFARLAQVSPGFDPAGVTTFRMSASWSESPASVVTRQARTVRRLEEVPGVDAAAVSQTPPAGIDYPPGEFSIVGREAPGKLFAQQRAVSGGYFRALHIPILQGEVCGNDPATPLFFQALVTRAFADQFFPGETAVGHALRPQLPPDREVAIIGIVGDVRESGVMRPAEPLIYWCGYSPYWPDPFFIVRASAAHPASVAAIRAALFAIEPKRAMYAVRPLEESLSRSISQQRLNTVLLSVFAATALLVAALGVYGVLSQVVAGQRRDIGIRMAVGARAAQIVTSILGQAAAMTLAGAAIGIAGASVLVRVMATLLFGISTYDPVTFVIVPLVLALVAGAAAVVPARRAAAIDPVQALRDSQ
ncbi:MAG TPA: ABC transporter permease [Vicinamibacterales bacterium]|nr:ABC transporter permease [Vicinamibacterales bacterium]